MNPWPRAVAPARAMALGLGLCVLGCGIDLARPPVARVRLSPTAVPQADGYATVITADGTGSDDDLTNPMGGGLTYGWRASDPDVRFEGDVTAPRVTLRVRGTAPVTVWLTVQTRDGRTASTTAVLALTVP